MRQLVLNPSFGTREFENIFDGFFQNLSTASDSSNFVPKVNISEDDSNVRLTFELPGMEKGDIKVIVQDGILTVSGERKFEKKEETDKYVRSEIRAGSFSRSFTLSDTVNHETVSADYKNGLLEVSLAKKEETKPREIEVKVS